MNKIILIIGAGQLGSRHMQGLLKLEANHTIYVIDPSPASQKMAMQRADEIIHNHTIYYGNNWDNLPDYFDLVIVATNANIRSKIVTYLLNNYTVKYLILEKVLFQDLETFKIVGDLIEKNKVKTWVNHPRRMFNSYKKLKQTLIPELPKVYQITGGNWGLGCNGLHFIDLVLFLSGSELSSLEAEWVDHQLLESKRSGFVEFTGTVKGCLDDGSIFYITSLKGQSSAITISVFDSNNRFIIQEGETPKIYCMTKDNGFRLEENSFSMEFQSNLTTLVSEQLFSFGICDLPTYDEARKAHELFIASLLEKYISLTKIRTKSLPIT